MGSGADTGVRPYRARTARTVASMRDRIHRSGNPPDLLSRSGADEPFGEFAAGIRIGEGAERAERAEGLGDALVPFEEIRAEHPRRVKAALPPEFHSKATLVRGESRVFAIAGEVVLHVRPLHHLREVERTDHLPEAGPDAKEFPIRYGDDPVALEEQLLVVVVAVAHGGGQSGERGSLRTVAAKESDLEFERSQGHRLIAIAGEAHQRLEEGDGGCRIELGLRKRASGKGVVCKNTMDAPVHLAGGAHLASGHLPAARGAPLDPWEDSPEGALVFDDRFAVDGWVGEWRRDATVDRPANQFVFLFDALPREVGAVLSNKARAVIRLDAVVPVQGADPNRLNGCGGNESVVFEQGSQVFGHLQRIPGLPNQAHSAVPRRRAMACDVSMSNSPVLQYRISMPFAEAEQTLRLALQAEGFGILTEVDVQATLRAKLGIETPAHKLLGACNPKLAHAAIEAEPTIGAFLPCGVAIREGATAGETLVALQNPALLAEMFDSEELLAPSKEAEAKLRTVLESVGTAL